VATRGNVNCQPGAELQFAQNVSHVFLWGTNLKRASCHDSFIDSWKLNGRLRPRRVIADKPL